MRKSIISLLLVVIMLIGILPTSVFAVTLPEIYKDTVTVRVGNTAKVGITYGDSATKATVVISNPNIEAYIAQKTLYIDGYAPGISYVTLNFDDGTSDNIQVTVVDKYSSVNDYNEIEIEKGDTKNIYIDLEAFDADKATISYDSDYATVNKSTFTSSGTLKISGKYVGEFTLRIKYDTGDAEVYDVSVVEEYLDSENEERFYLYEDESFTYFVDLDYYNADKATVSYDSYALSVNKSTFYANGSLTITAKTAGNHTVRIKHDSGDIEYLYVVVYEDEVSESDDSYVSIEELEIEKGESAYFYVYLGNNADKATLTLSNSNITLSSSVLYNDGRVKVTGRYVGETELKVSYDDGTRIYIPVTVTQENYIEPYAEMDSNKLKKGETTELEIFFGSNNTRATITIDSPKKIKLGVNSYSTYQTSYTIYGSKNETKYLAVEGIDYTDEATVTVKFPEGKSFKMLLSVVETKIEKTDGKDKLGVNYSLKEGITTDKEVLEMGYIAGYTNGTFGPLNTITREEFGVILARIVNYDGDIDSTDFIYDVTADWSKESIAELVAMGAVDKNQAYRPKEFITRYEVAEMLYNILDLNDYSTACPLTDVDNSYIGKKIAKCWNAGLIAGYSDGTFGGNRNITRAEAVVLVNRIFYENMNTTKKNIFPDVETSYWAYPYIVKASKQ